MKLYVHHIFLNISLIIQTSIFCNFYLLQKKKLQYQYPLCISSTTMSTSEV